MSAPQRAISTYLLEARQLNAALEKDLESASQPHSKGTLWQTEREQKLLMATIRPERFERMETVLP